MNDSRPFQSKLSLTQEPPNIVTKTSILRLIRAEQPITHADVAGRLRIDKNTATAHLKPLIASGVLSEETVERSRVVSFANVNDYFIGVNLGVRRSQVGITTLKGGIEDEDDFETPVDARTALRMVRERIEKLYNANTERQLRVIGVSVPGMTDALRGQLVNAPNLNWKNINIADALRINDAVKVVVENDAAAAAMYEARVKISDSEDGSMSNFVLVRSGTGISVGLVIGGEVYRGSGLARGLSGELGHMTIVAGGKPCVCGNRGCWEKYASAASAASLYLGDRPPGRGESVPRFVEIVSKAENGDNRSRRTLEKIGDYLGIGIANVIMGVGIPRVIISGRLVYGWSFIKGPMNEAIERNIVGKIDGWSVEAGEPAGAAIGGALEVAVEEYLSSI